MSNFNGTLNTLFSMEYLYPASGKFPISQKSIGLNNTPLPISALELLQKLLL